MQGAGRDLLASGGRQPSFVLASTSLRSVVSLRSAPASRADRSAPPRPAGPQAAPCPRHRAGLAASDPAACHRSLPLVKNLIPNPQAQTRCSSPVQTIGLCLCPPASSRSSAHPLLSARSASLGLYPTRPPPARNLDSVFRPQPPSGLSLTALSHAPPPPPRVTVFRPRPSPALDLYL